MPKKLLNKPNLSKIIMGVSMMGFFGMFSANTASAACWEYTDPGSCHQNNCQWFDSFQEGCNSYVNSQCWGLEKAACEAGAKEGGCHWGILTGMGYCAETYNLNKK
ncbi:MAG: hypothetical protein KBD90_02055 [Alphaproteobacteria bacterium]|nr:hypothetical protein [Alphaproteobacteria bacterium]